MFERDGRWRAAGLVFPGYDRGFGVGDHVLGAVVVIGEEDTVGGQEDVDVVAVCCLLSMR